MPIVQLCKHVSLTINEWGNGEQLPDDCWPVTAHTPFDAGPWASGIYMCGQCETCCTLFYNPKDDVFDECQVLPEVMKLACRRAISVDAMGLLLGYPFSPDHSRNVPLRLTRACLSAAECHSQDMFNMLLQRVEASLDEISCRSNTDWLLRFLRGEFLQRQWVSAGRRQPILRCASLQVWQRALDWAPLMADAIRVAFVIPVGEASCLVNLDTGNPADRLQLLDEAGIEISTMPQGQPQRSGRAQLFQPTASFRSQYSRRPRK